MTSFPTPAAAPSASRKSTSRPAAARVTTGPRRRTPPRCGSRVRSSVTNRWGWSRGSWCAPEEALRQLRRSQPEVREVSPRSRKRDTHAYRGCAGVSQLAEEKVLKTSQCGFESRRRHTARPPCGTSRHHLGELRAGDFFGEIALLDGGPRTATVTAVSAMKCLVLSRGQFHNVIRQNALIAVSVLETLGARLRTLLVGQP